MRVDEPHEPVTSHAVSGHPAPITVRPYCRLCSIPWPCPSAMAEQARGDGDASE